MDEEGPGALGPPGPNRRLVQGFYWRLRHLRGSSLPSLSPPIPTPIIPPPIKDGGGVRWYGHAEGGFGSNLRPSRWMDRPSWRPMSLKKKTSPSPHPIPPIFDGNGLIPFRDPMDSRNGIGWDKDGEWNGP